MNPKRSSPHPRWWIACLILTACTVLLVWIWAFLTTPTQDRVVKTLGVISGGGLALFLWAILLSRFSGRVRLSVLLGGPAAFGLFHLTFVVTGYTGDLVPIVRLRASVGDELRAEPLLAEPALTEVAAQPGNSLDTGPPAQTWRDSPQFLGPGRDATWPDLTLDRDLETNPPRLVWEREVGSAWSGFSVRGRDAITQEQRAELECVVCYDLLTGELRWLHSTGARFDESLGGVGPRATPTITKDRVVTMGATGILTCLDRATGELQWSRDVIAENNATPNEWGVSGSPLVLGQRVIVCAGGDQGRSLIAYDVDSGAEVWAGGGDAAGYASPQIATLLGERQIISFNRETTTGHDPESGAVLWSFPWYQRNPNVAQPWVIGDDQILVSSGYGFGCSLHQISRGSDGVYQVERLWKTLALKAKFSNFVVADGYAYGFDDGILACVLVATGKRRWKGGRYGHGQVIRCADTLLVTGEFGDIILVEASPEEHRELASFQAFDEKTWSTPCFATPYLLLRTERQAACYELTLADR